MQDECMTLLRRIFDYFSKHALSMSREILFREAHFFGEEKLYSGSTKFKQGLVVKLIYKFKVIYQVHFTSMQMVI